MLVRNDIETKVLNLDSIESETCVNSTNVSTDFHGINRKGDKMSLIMNLIEFDTMLISFQKLSTLHRTCSLLIQVVMNQIYMRFERFILRVALLIFGKQLQINIKIGIFLKKST